ncbi:MAG: hypothetical protein ACE5JG_12495, partial [Planctomycetota bacterium]
PDAPATAEEARELAALLTPEVWKDLPEWRQREMLARLRRYRSLPAEKRDRMRPRLKELLLRPGRMPDVGRLPPALLRSIRQLPRPRRKHAVKYAVVRWRQLQLDRALRRFPDVGRRREWFDRLFPEPFDPKRAREAHDRLRKEQSLLVAAEIRPELEQLDRREPGLQPAQREKRRKELARRLLAERTRVEAERAARRIEPEIRRWFAGREGRRPPILGRSLLKASPRERELIRYALRPRDCPWLDPKRLVGPPPRDREDRRRWQRDFEILARLDLLSRCRFRVDQALHLAASADEVQLLAELGRIRGRWSGAPGGRARGQGPPRDAPAPPSERPR